MAKEVLSYFVSHPLAADTLEGVARWRLLDEVIRRRLDDTEAALGWLVDRGYLTTFVARDGAATFRLNQERAEEARQFLSGALSTDRNGAP